MIKKVLVTGAKGFIGSNAVKYFKSMGYETFGIGHGHLTDDDCKRIGLDHWCQGELSINSLRALGAMFDVIVHCGGSGSVGFSVEKPYEDFKKTVDGTLEVLEFMRLFNEKAQLIYPSSPSVQGECADEPIRESYIGEPVSPYGYHKKIAEDLCKSYSDKFGLKVVIIRLFSVYGEGLRKQFLWDACNKIKDASEPVSFHGTGGETRDFIHINDVLGIVYESLRIEDRFSILNGGVGIRYTIGQVASMLNVLLGGCQEITFNMKKSEGNPEFYWADLTKLNEINHKSKVSLEQGLSNYVKWYLSECND